MAAARIRGRFTALNFATAKTFCESSFTVRPKSTFLTASSPDPWVGGGLIARELDVLETDFPRHGLPSHGRYVCSRWPGARYRVMEARRMDSRLDHTAEKRSRAGISESASSIALETLPGRDRWFGRLAMVQGVFYVVTGIWPTVHLRSFLAVTGPKTDLWLVQTVGALLAVVGCVLWRAGVRRAVTAELFILAVGAATVLATVDIIFVTKDVISPIYLLDAVAETALVLAWLVCAAVNRTRPDGR